MKARKERSTVKEVQNMKDIERTIGVLEEQGRWQAKKLDAIEQSNLQMNHKIDSLLSFKWKALGALSIVSFIATALVELARARG